MSGNGPTACPICSGTRRELFRARLLNKYDVRYFHCESCGLLQTEKPYWLEESYSRAITASDTGLVARNVSLSKIVASLLYFLFGKKGRYLDAAGGYGLLTRLMRDIGFDFYWSDPYCENLHAAGFEASAVSPPFNVVTAFEVLEHVEDPAAFVRKILADSKTRNLIFSTFLYQGNPPAPGQWWYYGMEHGQHISFFQRRTLEWIAKELGLILYSHGYIHMLTDRKYGKALFWLLTSRLAPLFSGYVQLRMTSRTMLDHELLSRGGGTHAT